MKIYVASSWRTPRHDEVVNALRDAGHTVYNYREPASGGHGFSWEQKLNTLVVNSLLETNLGAVPIFCIYALVTARFSESGARRPGVAFSERVKEINLRAFRGMPLDEPVPVQNPAPQPAAAAPVTVPADDAAPAERPPVRP